MIKERLGLESYPMVILFKNGTIVNQCAHREAYRIVEWV
jgi:thioredoxin-like negative regulator of GroEL